MDKTNPIEPTEGFLLIDPVQQSKLGDIELHDTDDFPQAGIVIKVGKPTYYENTDLEREAPCLVGDEILHSSFGWEHIKWQGKKLRLVPFNKVIAVIKR